MIKNNLKKRANLRTLLIAVIFAVAVTAIAFGAANLSGVNAHAQSIEISGVMESFVPLNTEAEIPSSFSVDYNGNRTADNGVVVFPDGKIVNAGKKIKFNQTGVYQLRYYFDYSGITHTAVQKVEVYSDHFNLSSPSGGDIIVSDDENKLYCGKDGIIVNLKSGTTFVYNKVLDLRDCDEDGLSKIIELDGRYGHFDEDGKYVPEVLESWVRLTDCYNPRIYMELRMQKSVNYSGTLFPGVKTNNQQVTGMDKGVTQVLGNTRIINLDGYDYRVWMNSGSMNVGMYDMKTPMTTGTIWKYDMNTKRVYLSFNDKDNFLVSDLDEPLIYTNGNYFPGFTTGEVFVSIYADGYESAYARTEIVSIGNDNMKDVADKPCVDTLAPIIDVNKIKTTPTGVYGAVGDVFEIPSATATDVNIYGDVDVAVYRGYGTNMQTNVSVDNGKFTLSHKDLYSIVYTAKDKSGNVGEEIFTVSTLETPDNRSITLNPFSSDTVSAGMLLDNLYEITDSINVDKDDVEVKIKVESEKQNITGKGTDFSFTPYYEGNYTVRYEYTDGVFEYEKVVNLRCERSSNVCFTGKAITPKYYLKGDYYAIDDVGAISFSKGYPEEVEKEIYAVFDDGEEIKINDPSKVRMTGNESVYFLYKAKNAETLVTEKVPIINADYYNEAGRNLGYDMSKFFIGDFNANAYNSDGKRIKNITFTSNKTSGDNKLSFFNGISGRKFAFEYRIVSRENNFNSLKINLTDKLNSENTLSVQIFNNPDATYISVNGGKLTKVESIAFTNSVINVSYDYESRLIRVNDFAELVDFDAATAYLDVEMLGITGKSSIIISKINNTVISGNSYTDTFEPEIYIYDFQGDYQVGDVVKTRIPEFSDVISGIDYKSATVLISCSDGNPVKDSKGNVLSNLKTDVEYEILLDRIAKYYVVYTVNDFNDNTFTKTVMLNCADVTAPTINLNNIKAGQTLKVRAGDEIKVNFTVSDNVTRPKDIIVYIHLYCVDMYSYVPNVTNIKQKDAPENGVYDEKFVINIKGRYQARINATDSEGNVCVCNIDIVVE